MDDISVVLQCDFPTDRNLLDVMSRYYPDMPLNVQISFGYSRFLDLHLYNVNIDMSMSDTYSLSRVLAYKELSSFIYTPHFSNIHGSYKHAVVPIYLYRIHARNSHQADVNNHLYFMYKILQDRMQDPVEVKRKTRRFFLKKQGRILFKRPAFKNCCFVKFDKVSNRHHFMYSLLKRSRFSLRLRYKSGSNLGSLLCPKRRVINTLSHFLKDDKM